MAAVLQQFAGPPHDQPLSIFTEHRMTHRKSDRACGGKEQNSDHTVSAGYDSLLGEDAERGGDTMHQCPWQDTMHRSQHSRGIMFDGGSDDGEARHSVPRGALAVFTASSTADCESARVLVPKPAHS